ncbi:MAG: hypothetical protein EXR21_09090 [Flavobacteriaceae bacterium]|nr:hypothetical protein [Flavobacteriaceae bacterium]
MPKTPNGNNIADIGVVGSMTTPKAKRHPIQHEHNVIKAVVVYLTTHRSKPLFFHVPNEGKRSLHQQRMAKQSGLTKGVADIIILEPKKYQEDGTTRYHGMCLELKAETNKLTGAKKGTTSVEQLAFLKAAEERGYYAKVAFGFDMAKSYIDTYLHKP